MKFSELVKLLAQDGFKIIKERGLIRLQKQNFLVPPQNPDPKIIIENEKQVAA